MAVYCYQKQVPLPDLGAGLGLMLGLILLFLLLAGVFIAYIVVAPALASAVVFPPEAGDGEVRRLGIGKRLFAVWYGAPLSMFWVLLWASATDEMTGWGMWLWLLVPIAVVSTSFWVSRKLPENTVGAGRPWQLAQLSMGLVGCAVVALMFYIKPLSHWIGDWPSFLQWGVLVGVLAIYACLVYLQLEWPAAIRRRDPRKMMLAFAFILIGGAFTMMAQPAIAVPVVAQFLRLLQRGGGEWVELVIATDVARTQGAVAPSVSAPKVRCRAQLLLEFGDETSVRFEGQRHVLTMRASEVDGVIRSSRKDVERDKSASEPTRYACVATAAQSSVD